MAEICDEGSYHEARRLVNIGTCRVGIHACGERGDDEAPHPASVWAAGFVAGHGLGVRISWHWFDYDHDNEFWRRDGS